MQVTPQKQPLLINNPQFVSGDAPGASNNPLPATIKKRVPVRSFYKAEKNFSPEQFLKHVKRAYSAVPTA
ncbi:MAG: hypothetical protein ABI855_01245 [Bacteroidota bacterium]